jgi:putative chitinase
MNKDKFFDAIRPLFGKLNQQQADSMDKMLASLPTGILRTQLAYGLATTFHETAQTMMPITEYGPKSYFSKYDPGTKIGKDLGNTKPGDGYLYRGRGFVQITGRRNYTFVGDKIGFPLANEPDLALDWAVARKIAREGFLNGWFTGKKITDYINKDKTDYKNARRCINGVDKADKIAGYAVKFEAALKAGGIL